MIIWYNRQNYTVFYTSRFNNVELLKHYFDENTLFSPSILIIISISFLPTIMDILFDLPHYTVFFDFIDK